MASRLEWWGGICTSAVFSHILRYLEPNAAAKVTGTSNPTEKNHAGPVTTEIWEVPKVSQKTIPDGAFTHKCSQIQNNWMAWDWKTIPKNQKSCWDLKLFAANKKKGYTKVSSCYGHPKYGKWKAGLHPPSAGSLVSCITPAMKRNETRSCPVEKYDPRKGHPVT